MHTELRIQYSDFRSQIMTIEELFSHLSCLGTVHILSKSSRTSRAQQSRMIEAILLNIPQMPFFIDDTQQSWTVIEGIERMEAIYAFISNKLSLTSTYFRTGVYEGKTFSSLSLFERNIILNTKVEVYAINSGLSGQERFGIYMCFKSRNDSAAISWCRSRIYPQEYAEIEKLAKRINSHRKDYIGNSDVMENRICHLLLGINFQSYLHSDDKHHIDHAINALFEQSNYLEVLKNYSTEMENILLNNRGHSNTGIPKIQFIADSVAFHLHHTNHQVPTFQQLAERYKQIMPPNKAITFTAESFCHTIDMILKSYL